MSRHRRVDVDTTVGDAVSGISQHNIDNFIHDLDTHRRQGHHSKQRYFDKVSQHLAHDSRTAAIFQGFHIVGIDQNGVQLSDGHHHNKHLNRNGTVSGDNHSTHPENYYTKKHLMPGLSPAHAFDHHHRSIGQVPAVGPNPVFPPSYQQQNFRPMYPSDQNQLGYYRPGSGNPYNQNQTGLIMAEVLGLLLRNRHSAGDSQWFRRSF